MMPFYLPMAWYKGTSCMACDVLTNVPQLHVPTGAHLATPTNMLPTRVQKVAREEGPGCLQLKEQTAAGAGHGVHSVQFN